MTRVRRGMRALGLSFLAAMGLMAFMAAGAQATAWDVNGVLLGDSLLPQLDGVLKGEFLFLTKTATGTSIVLHCKKLTVTAGNLHKTDAHITIQVDNSTCLTLVNGVNQKNCGGEVVGGLNILPIKALVTPVLHNGDVYLLAKPLTGPNFTSKHYGALCSLPLVNIAGSILFECEDGSLNHRTCEFAAVKQLVKTVTNQALLGDLLTYGANHATLHAEAEVFLKGAAHVGLPFSAL
jgi:hypothetical protein